MTTRAHSILLDAEPLSARSLDERRIYPWIAFARRTRSRLYASSATLAEVADGTPRDAKLRRATKDLNLVPVSKEIGFSAGALRRKAHAVRRKPRDLTLDALVAATALTLPTPVVVLTSDPNDLTLLLEGTHASVKAI